MIIMIRFLITESMIIVIMKIVVIIIVMIACVIKEPGVLRQSWGLWPWQVTFLEMVGARDCIS